MNTVSQSYYQRMFEWCFSEWLGQVLSIASGIISPTCWSIRWSSAADLSACDLGLFDGIVLQIVNSCHFNLSPSPAADSLASSLAYHRGSFQSCANAWCWWRRFSTGQLATTQTRMSYKERALILVENEFSKNTIGLTPKSKLLTASETTVVLWPLEVTWTVT